MECDREKTKYVTWRKCHSTATLSTTNPRKTALGLNPDILDEWYVDHTKKNIGVYDHTAFQYAQYFV